MKIDLSKVITVDAETFYSTEFSLSKAAYNTSSYVRDPQFKEHCWGIKQGNAPAKCYAPAAGIKLLKKIDWSTHYLLAHNTAFDGFILAHHHGIIPHFYLDTLSMTRGLHAEVSRAKLDTIAKLYGLGGKSATYLTPTKGLRSLPPDVLAGLMEGCTLDVELCFAVFCKQLEVYPADELDLIDLTMRMFCDSKLRVDLPRAASALRDEILARESAILKSGQVEKTLMSNPKFATCLLELGITPPTKISAVTGYASYAFAQTDAEFLDLLDHENISVVRLAQGRLAAKSTQTETRAHRLLEAGKDGMALPAGYTYYAAKTGRWGGTNKLNLQNLQRKSELRRSIIAPAKHVLVVTDSAQIEARVLAWLTKQNDVVEAFACGLDVYKRMATTIYGVAEENIDDLQRFVGKVAILGLGYGMGGKKFQTTLALGTSGPPVHITLAAATRIVNLYRSTNSRIRAAWREADLLLHRMMRGETGTAFSGLIEYDATSLWLPNGMGIHYPNMHITPEGIKYTSFDAHRPLYGGLVVENVTQALARIVVGEQVLATQTAMRKHKLQPSEVAAISMLTHDEEVATVPERLAEKQLAIQLKCMRTAPAWCPDLPVNAAGEYARFYIK